MADSTDKTKLTAELAAARGRMAGYVAALRHDFDFGAKLKVGVAKNPAAWFAGAAVVGLLLSKIPPSPRKVVVKGPALRGSQAEQGGKAALLLTLLKFSLDFAKPALIAWTKKSIFTGRSRRASERF